MLTLTESAGTRLTQLLSENPDDTVVRLVPAQNGLALELSAVQSGDVTVAHGERTVLAMGAEVNEALADKTLDVQETEQGVQLTLR